MFIVREIRHGDTDLLLDLVKELHDVGLAPQIRADHASLEGLIEGAVACFKAANSSETNATYIFVLEDIHQKLILGISFLQATDLAPKLEPPLLHPDYQNLPLHLERHLSDSRLIYATLHPDRFLNDFSNDKIQSIQLSPNRLRTTGDLALLGSRGSQGFVCFHIHYRHDEQGILITDEALQIMKTSGANLESLYFLPSN